MAYLSLYRKWRPQTFADVVGQEHVVRTLKNALDQKRTAHAYVFSGPRGTGKTTLARLLAKGLNCVQGPTGDWCNECDNCVRIAKGQSVDVIEIDGASNRGIDEIRDVREKVKFAPAEGRYKVYIIDEVHMLTTEAFNALLKVLEEPPGHVVFVFATTEAYRIPATILSRCQHFDFHAFSPAQIADQVRQVAQSEGVKIDEGALRLIARHSEGGMRDALGYLDQCIAFADQAITESLAAQVLGVVERERLEALADAIADRELGRCLTMVKEVLDAGCDLRQFTRDAVQFFRDLMLLRAAPDAKGLVVIAPDEMEATMALAERFSVTESLRIVERLGRAESDMRWAESAQLVLEMALIEVVRERGAPSLAEIDERLRAIEEKLAGGGLASPPVLEAPRPDIVKSEGAAVQPGHVGTRGARPAENRLQGTWAPETANAEVRTPESRATETQTQLAEAQETKSTEPQEQEHRAQESVGTGDRANSAGDAVDLEGLDRIRAEWPRILEALRGAKYVQQEAFLREGTPGSFDGRVLKVYFPKSRQFHQANVAQEKNRAVVEKMIGKLLGLDVVLEAILGDPPPRPAAAGPPPAAKTSERVESSRSAAPRTGGGAPPEETDDVMNDPVLKAALKIFGGTITRIERKEAD